MLLTFRQRVHNLQIKYCIRLTNFFNSELADITHCDWEEMQQKEMTKERRTEDNTVVTQDLKKRRMG